MDDTVILIVEDKHYEFSKKKLCERSEYFNAMFNSDFVEKTKKTVKLEVRLGFFKSKFFFLNFIIFMVFNFHFQGVSVTSWEHIMYFLKNGRIKPHQVQEQERKDRIREMVQLLQDSTMLQFIDIQGEY